MSKDITQFDNVYHDLSRASGSDIRSAFWSRTGRGFELRLGTRNGNYVRFDGFEADDHRAVEESIKRNFGINLESFDHSLRGWNWGKTNFQGNELVFNVSGRPDFEIPVSSISNSNLTGKNEVSLEFALTTAEDDGPPRAQTDELSEMRIFIPGAAEKDEDAGSDEENTAADTSAAQQFYDTIREKADISEVAGDSIVTFADTFFITPRGRYDVEMYPGFMRLRGKTYDYKIQFSSIAKLFLLPKSDDVHVNFVVGIDPPLRQGQTRYPFLVAQFLREEEMEVDLNLNDEDYEKNYQGKVDKSYDAAAYKVVSQVFKGLTGRKITTPGTFASHDNHSSVKCSYKANEGQLYMLERNLLFIPKPPIYMSLGDVLSVTLSRVGASVTASRTFDILFQLKGNLEYQFSNVNREEQPPLEQYFKSKGVKVRDETNENASSAMIQAALNADVSDEDESDVERGSAEEDSESPDEDFQGGSDSDVAEEYDENAPESDSPEEDEE